MSKNADLLRGALEVGVDGYPADERQPKSTNLGDWIRQMIWMAQTTHQAYHDNRRCTWATCPMPVCAATGTFLRDAGFGQYVEAPSNAK